MKSLLSISGWFVALLVALASASAIAAPALADAANPLHITLAAEARVATTYRWSIEKEASPRNVVVYPGQPSAVDYTVTVAKDLAQIERAIGGAVQIRNASNDGVTLTGVSVIVAPNLAALVRCGVSFPYALAAGQTLACSYEAAVPDASTRTVVATVAVHNARAVSSASATASFARPATSAKLDTITVSDAYAGLLGSTAASRSWTFRRFFACDPGSGAQHSTATILETGQTAQAVVGVVCAQPQAAACTHVAVAARDRAPAAGQTIRVEGHGLPGGGAGAATAYRFVFGDGEQTAWSAIRSWPAVASHAYARAGAYTLQFEMRLADGRIIGGGGTQCAVLIEVSPPLVCGARAPIVITGVSQTHRRLALTGLAADNARVAIQIKGPAEADFRAGGIVAADAFGVWAFTTAALDRDGTYQIRAAGYGQMSENTVSYVMGSGAELRVAAVRSGGAVSDSYISAVAPAASYAAQPNLALSPAALDILLRFDLSAIPGGARIAMAKLSLYALDDLPCTAMAGAIYQLARPWDPGSVTWLQAATGRQWNAPSAGNAPDDRADLPAHTTQLRGPQAWYTWDLTPLAQRWAAAPTSNNGVIVKAATDGAVAAYTANSLDGAAPVVQSQPVVAATPGQRSFASSEHPLAQRRPILYVTYVLP